MSEEPSISIYCPSCGEGSDHELVDLTPGEVYWGCPNCGTEWEIHIAFVEQPAVETTPCG